MRARLFHILIHQRLHALFSFIKGSGIPVWCTNSFGYGFARVLNILSPILVYVVNIGEGFTHQCAALVGHLAGQFRYRPTITQPREWPVWRMINCSAQKEANKQNVQTERGIIGQPVVFVIVSSDVRNKGCLREGLRFDLPVRIARPCGILHRVNQRHPHR